MVAPRIDGTNPSNTYCLEFLVLGLWLVKLYYRRFTSLLMIVYRQQFDSQSIIGGLSSRVVLFTCQSVRAKPCEVFSHVSSKLQQLETLPHAMTSVAEALTTVLILLPSGVTISSTFTVYAHVCTSVSDTVEDRWAI